MIATLSANRINLTFSYNPAVNAKIKDISGWRYEEQLKQWSVPLLQAPKVAQAFTGVIWEPGLGEIRSAAARHVCEALNAAGLTVALRFSRTSLGVQMGEPFVAMLDGAPLENSKLRSGDVIHSAFREFRAEILALLESGETFTVTEYGNPNPAPVTPCIIGDSDDAKLLRAYRGGKDAEERKQVMATRRRWAGKGRSKSEAKQMGMGV